MINPSDEWYIEQIKLNNVKAENDLFTRFNGLLLKHVAQNSGGKDEADVLYIETMITVYEQIKSGKLNDMTCSLKAYIFSVGRLKWFELLREKKRTGIIKSYDSDDFFNETGVRIEDEDVEEETVTMVEKLWLVISKLQKKCREILLDKYFNNLNPDEIAKRYEFLDGRQATKGASKCMSKARKIGREIV